MDTRSNSLKHTDIKTVLHPFTDARVHEEIGPTIISRGEGIYVYDSEGRAYIEGLAGLWSVAVGFSEPRLVDAAMRQMQILPYYHTFAHKAHEPSIRLAEKLVEWTPANLTRAFFTSSGSEATDTVIRLVRYHNNALGRPDKKKFIARNKAYHGTTLAAGSLTCLPVSHCDFDLPGIPVVHVTCPHFYRFGLAGETEQEFTARLLEEIEDVIVAEGPETVGAFIGEPLMGAGGVLPPPAGYWQGVEALCKKYEILLIADEVINGFGRLGSRFGCEHYGFVPDIAIMSKQLTSSYMPLAAVMMSEDIYNVVADNSHKIGVFGHGFTATGHPVATAVALENLAIIEELDLVGNARSLGPQLKEGLSRLNGRPFVGEVRAEGLIAAVELVADPSTKRTFSEPGRVGAEAFRIAHAEGLIFRAIGDTLALCPPLIVSSEQIDLIVEKMSRVVDRVGDWVHSEARDKA
ncbi:aspartate aminotransferase family protein [Pararhizobium sp. YC-54]|uniref:aspartate aminotransferase family protein n=1 Tax=Pararhizobium sp. YC-54 TaxID=2986920 RepID=UPI0021F76B00|nr:aspartate aminotransferase family protein [Pararhizobium sp. YC-54]MCW0002133.1 aspartate aminotransferase family protein [Pararhizobium sp. YC-54]